MDGFTWSLPGKVFLYGEYAVLTDLPCAIVSVPPRFECLPLTLSGDLSEKKGPTLESFHELSPAGMLRRRCLEHSKIAGESSERYFWDPYQGQGGFGGSTAEFAFALVDLVQRGWKSGLLHGTPREQALSVWALYREITRPDEGVTPSGADLLSQWMGGITRVRLIDGQVDLLDALSSDGLAAWRSKTRLLVFSAAHQPGRKVATHFHLSRLSSLLDSGDLKKNLAPVVSALDRALIQGDSQGLGVGLNRFADSLSQMGLEIRETSLDREAFSQVPGVLGVKGTGAMQADSIVIVLDRSSVAYDECLRLGALRDLRLVLEDWPQEKGFEISSARLEPTPYPTEKRKVL